MKSPLFLVAGLFVLLNGSLWAQRPLTPLKNPDRGWHLESIPMLFDSNGVVRNPYYPTTTDMTQLLSSPEFYVSNKLKDPQKLTLSQSYFYLTNFVGKRISPKALAAIDSMFDVHRKRGYKIILRFAYDLGIRTSKARYSDMYRHLDQLAPIIQKNAGLIHTWQAGFLGPWGEWHSTDRYDSTTAPPRKLYDLKDSPDSMRVLVRKMLDIIPQGGTVQLRIPYYRGLLAFEDGLTQRLGLHNDCFTAGAHPLAGGNDYVDNAYVSYYTDAQKASPYVPVLGEMPYDGTGSDPFLFNSYMSVSKALQTFRDHHYTALDITQNTPTNILRWTTYQLTADSLNAAGIAFHPEYFKDNGVTVPRTMFQFVRDHLGYNLYFDYDKDIIRTAGGNLSFSLPFRNYGFSRVYNRYKVFAFLLNGSNQIKARIPINVNPADWHPFRPGDVPSSRMQHYLQGAIPLPAGLATGSYKLGFGILPLSPDVTGDSAFCIRFANRSNLTYVTIGDTVVNISHTFSYNTTAQYCAPSSDAAGQERYFTQLRSDGATQNIQLTSPLRPVNAYALADQAIRGSQGSSFNLNATTTDDSKYSRIRAWVDWNGDGRFADTTEVAFAIGNPNTVNDALLKNFVQTIAIPANAKAGSTVMRIRFYQAWQSNPGPCGYQIQNTTYDFPVYVDSTILQSFCATTSVGGVTDRHITSLSTSGAKHNLNVPAMAVPVDNYQFFKNDVVVAEPGTSFTLAATTTDHTKWDVVKAWIDWNGDGTLADDSTETVFVRGVRNPATDNGPVILNFSQAVSVPVSAKPGLRRFRIRFGDAWYPFPGPCGNSANATTYDLLLNIQAPGYCVPSSDNNAQDRYLTSLKTTRAVRDLAITAPLLPQGGYRQYTADYLGVSPGSTFDLIGTSSDNSKWSQVRAWADWNGDGIFSDNASEILFDLGMHAPTAADSAAHNASIRNFSQSVFVPESVKLGATRIRIRYYDAWEAYPGSCGYATKNTTFDFVVKVEAPVGSAYCSAGSNGKDQERYLTSLSTTGATHNLVVPAASLVPVNGYNTYREDAVAVAPGSTFNLSGTSTPNTKWNRISLWVDWNGNGTFDAAESVFSLGTQNADDNGPVVLNFTQGISVPATAKPGTVRARIRVHNSWFAVPGPCGDAPNTTNFDFLVRINGTTYCEPKTDTLIYAPFLTVKTLSTSGAVHNLNMTTELTPVRGYRQYENDVLVVNAGTTVKLHATTSELTKYGQARAWADWNGDGTFTDGGAEELFSLGNFHCDSCTVNQNFRKSIHIPATAKTGYTRLRFRIWNSWLLYPGPCNFLDQSTTFDFPVLVLPSGTTTYSLPVSSLREAAAPAEASALTGVLYPSPVGQKPLHIQLNQPVSGKAEIGLFDVSGRTVSKQEVSVHNGLLEEDVRYLKPGLYILVLNVNGKALTFRFVKE